MEILISSEASFAMQTRSKGFTTIAFSCVISTKLVEQENWQHQIPWAQDTNLAYIDFQNTSQMSSERLIYVLCQGGKF